MAIKSNSYESNKQEGNMLTEQDLFKYATPEELDILKEDEEPKELTTDEKIEEEDKAVARRVITKMFNDVLAAKTAYENDLPKDAEFENMDIHSKILHVMDAVVTLKDQLEGE